MSRKSKEIAAQNAREMSAPTPTPAAPPVTQPEPPKRPITPPPSVQGTQVVRGSSLIPPRASYIPGTAVPRFDWKITIFLKMGGKIEADAKQLTKEETLQRIKRTLVEGYVLTKPDGSVEGFAPSLIERITSKPLTEAATK
jgi:hypothetical protein